MTELVITGIAVSEASGFEFFVWHAVRTEETSKIIDKDLFVISA